MLRQVVSIILNLDYVFSQGFGRIFKYKKLVENKLNFYLKIIFLRFREAEHKMEEDRLP
mgnify:CR=1 FL=1